MDAETVGLAEADEFLRVSRPTLDDILGAARDLYGTGEVTAHMAYCFLARRWEVDDDAIIGARIGVTPFNVRRMVQSVNEHFADPIVKDDLDVMATAIMERVRSR